MATALIERLKSLAASGGIYVICVQADYGGEPTIALQTRQARGFHFDIAPARSADQFRSFNVGSKGDWHMIEPKSSFPVFTVQDLDAAKSFYSKHLGFQVVFSNEWYAHLASTSGIQLGFLLPGQPTQPPIFQYPYGGKGVIFSLEVDDADAAFAAAQSQSLKIVFELRSEDWGQRHFCIQDPNGLYLDIVQSIEPTGEYRSGYASK